MHIRPVQGLCTETSEVFDAAGASGIGIDGQPLALQAQLDAIQGIKPQPIGTLQATDHNMELLLWNERFQEVFFNEQLIEVGLIVTVTAAQGQAQSRTEPLFIIDK